MYTVNGAGLMFSEIGALIAPRATLMCNATADPLYPMPYFNQLVDKMRVVYKLYTASDSLNTATAPGGHADSETIRLPVYEFFLREFLGSKEKITSHGAVDTLPDAELLCMRDGYPLDERLTRVHEEFMPKRGGTVPRQWSAEARQARCAEVINQLRERVFAALPQDAPAPELSRAADGALWGRRLEKADYQALPGVTVRASLSLPEKAAPGSRMPAVLVVKDGSGTIWDNLGATDPRAMAWGDRVALSIEPLDTRSRTLEDSLAHQMRRQAVIAGYSFDGIRIFEIMQGIKALRALPEVDPERVILYGRGEMGINALYAALLDGKVERVILESPTGSHLEGPYYPQVLTVTDIPEVTALLAGKVRVTGNLPIEIEQALGRLSPPVTAQRANLAECLE